MSILPTAVWAAAPTTVRGQPTPLSSDSKRIAYASNKSIFIRSIDDPSISKQYTQHTSETTVARFAPSGSYIASGDVAGTIRIWDAETAEKTRGEYPIIAGRINDIAWDGDSQRIIAVGNGRERFGHCVTADSGNSIGEISGHSSQINCVSIRQQRPLRAATGSDDKSLGFFHGAPFKFETSVRGKHDRFIFGTQFSPNGASLVSVGSDKRIWLYDGKTGEPLKQIGEGEHKGSIFGVSWAADSKKFVTCSGDQTVKIWDAEEGKCTQSWRLGDEGSVNISHQQLGVTWPAGRSDGLLVTVDLEGRLNYFQEGKAAPVKVIHGHQKAITAGNVVSQSKTLFTGSYEGRVQSWDLSSGSADPVDGQTHSNFVAGIAVSESNNCAYSTGWDDALRTIDISQKSFVGDVVKTDGQPKGIATATIGGKPHVLIATSNGVAIYFNGTKVGEQKLPSPPSCIAVHGETVAVGADDKKVRVFSAASPTAFDGMKELEGPAHPVSCLAFSPDGLRLAVGALTGKIFVFIKDGGAWKFETNRWSAHTARVTSIDWSPDGKKAVSAALDTNIYVWSITDPGQRVKVLNAHKEGVSRVIWPEEDKILSCGVDAAVKVWKPQGVH